MDRSSAPQNRMDEPLMFAYGLTPELLEVQGKALPAALAAEQRFVREALSPETCLSEGCKKAILAGVARIRGADFWTLHLESIESVSKSEKSILAFAGKLCTHPFSISSTDTDALRAAEFDDHAIVEAVVVAAWGEFLCTLELGLNPPRGPKLEE